MDYNEQMELAELISEAREIDKEVIERLPSSAQYQFSRVRDDVEVSCSIKAAVRTNLTVNPPSAP